MQQGSQAWLDWRAKGIGGSDAPIIVMGKTKYRTKHELWMEKTGKAKRDKGPSWAAQRGINLEPKARARYELLNSIECPPETLEHPDYPHFRVSLDGWNKEHGIVLEIKCPGRDDHATAKAGQVPEHYQWQLEMQLWVSGGKLAHYFSYYEEKLPNGNIKVDTRLIHYVSTPEKRAKLIKELHAFWECVTRNVAPSLAEKDSLVLEDLNAKDVFKQLGDVMAKRDEALALYDAFEDQYVELKKRAARFLTHSRVRCEGVELVRRLRNGKESIEARFVDQSA